MSVSNKKEGLDYGYEPVKLYTQQKPRNNIIRNLSKIEALDMTCQNI